MLRGQRLEDDMVVLFVNDRAGSLVDLEIFSKPSGNHYLPFDSEHHSVGLGCRIHNREYYMYRKSKSTKVLLEILRLSKPLELTLAFAVSAILYEIIGP
jgi:hypothetical protein